MGRLSTSLDQTKQCRDQFDFPIGNASMHFLLAYIWSFFFGFRRNHQNQLSIVYDADTHDAAMRFDLSTDPSSIWTCLRDLRSPSKPLWRPIRSVDPSAVPTIEQRPIL